MAPRKNAPAAAQAAPATVAEAQPQKAQGRGPSLNRVQLLGRLTRDPELRYTANGTAVCQLALATNRYGLDPQSGERREFTDYHDVVVWNQGNRKLAESCGQYLQKGRLVYVEGRLQTRSWADQQTGQKRYRTEVNASDVQFLDSRRAAADEPEPDADVEQELDPLAA